MQAPNYVGGIFAYSESKLTFHFVVVVVVVVLVVVVGLRRRVEKSDTRQKVPSTNARVFKLCKHLKHDTFYRW